MKISSIFVAIASCLLVHAQQIPIKSVEGLDADQPRVDFSELTALINQINGQYGTLLGDRSNVTIWSGKEHVSYTNGYLYSSNSNDVTIWEIHYPNQEQTATICTHLPFNTRCWDNGSGWATVSGNRPARYSPSLIGGQFSVFNGEYCLAKVKTDNFLTWSNNSACLRFDLKASREMFTSARPVPVDAIMAGFHSDMVSWDPMAAIGGVLIKTIGSVINAVAPDSEVAGRIRQAGDAWGYCGSVQC